MIRPFKIEATANLEIVLTRDSDGYWFATINGRDAKSHRSDTLSIETEIALAAHDTYEFVRDLLENAGRKAKEHEDFQP